MTSYEKVDPTLYSELIGVLGEPTREYKWWNHRQDYIAPGSGWVDYTMHSGKWITIAAEDLGLEGLHIIPGNSRSWMDLHTASIFDHDAFRGTDNFKYAVVMLDGYRIGKVRTQREKPQYDLSGADGTRGIWRTYAMKPDGTTWIYEQWTEWVQEGGWGARSNQGRSLDEVVPEGLWERVLELAKNPIKNTTQEMEDAIRELHPELRLAIANLVRELAGIQRGRFEVPYKGYRWSFSPLAVAVDQGKKEIEELTKSLGDQDSNPQVA